ncbi:BRE1-domain-containing [Pyrrhoderma noxium]|uniref:E3 ubiquitin protein ligase n=1 Tax=Pyrrhoderma noxium TaxID=2282107 RepID=A0A286UGY1_9AGAM|nr:BRE1-domain-containing [Pyrrhoderma noxium]
MDIQPARSDEESNGKRRATTEEWATNKKRVLDSMTGSPISSSTTTEEPSKGASNSPYGEFLQDIEDEEKLEKFRKAAIFRRMRHYQREFNGALRRIGRLEESLKRSSLERIQAETCWSMTVETIRQLIPLETIVAEAGESIKSLFSSRIFTSEDFESLNKGSQDKVQDTERVIRAFVKLAGKVDRSDYDTLFAECQELQKSNTFLTAEADATYKLMTDIRKERDQYAEELRDAQSTIERLQSRNTNPFPSKDSIKETPIRSNGEVKGEGSTAVGGCKQESEDVSMDDIKQANTPVDYEELRLRDERIAELESEQAKLRSRNRELELSLQTLPESAVMSSKAYQALLNFASIQEGNIKGYERKVQLQREEIRDYVQKRGLWVDQMTALLGKEAEEAKSLLQKREDDLNRIRQARDQLEAQLREATSKYESKWSCIEKYKALADTQGEQINQLSSEIQRLRTRLAATSGDEDLHSFLWKNKETNSSYVGDIQKRLSETQRELESLRATIRDQDQMIIDAASLRVRLEDSEKELSILRAASNGELEARVKAQDDELRTLRLQVSQNTEEMTALLSEIDMLSNSLEEAKRESQTQVITLEKWEEERQRLNEQKGRYETRYYKMMSENEAKEAERKVATRNFEKQIKLVDHLKEVEKSLRKTLETYEIDVYQTREEGESLRVMVRDLETEKQKLSLRTAELTEHNNALRVEVAKVEEEVGGVKMKMNKLRDELRKAKKETEKYKESQTTNVSSKSSDEPSTAEKLLKCNTCKLRFKNTIITKCMHTFCKECVDQQITLRSRKCPYCSVSFGLSEVHMFYFN